MLQPTGDAHGSRAVLGDGRQAAGVVGSIEMRFGRDVIVSAVETRRRLDGRPAAQVNVAHRRPMEERHVVDQLPQPRPAGIQFVHRRQRRTQPVFDPPAQNG